ncbi:MAG: hypothetical protein HN712_17930 [Gemmatimonadetes bacterium]|nr:hypothetical protein [Gemmatimonadota bacterium]MBT7862202.1 hypothetical protein [Gemmatimonadota bacterium]
MSPSSIPTPDADVHTLKDRVHELSARIIRLGEPDEDTDVVEDVETAHALALSIKPYVDRLLSLQHLMNPVGGIIEKQGQIQELQEELAEDIALVEHVTNDLDTVDPSLLQDLQTEIAAVKRDRRIDFDDTPSDGEEEEEEPPSVADREALQERSTSDRLKAIFGARFVGIDRLGEILGGSLPETETETANQALDEAWQRLISLPQMSHHVREGRLKALRHAFAEYALVYRTSRLPDGSPCHLAGLRELFEGRFVQSSERTLWYNKLEFYREPITAGHWALVDSQYLNCTFKRPKIRLMMYARANDLPPGIVRQKSLQEDIYDRLVLDDALEREFFANCHSLTRTVYQMSGAQSRKQVYVYYLDGQIRLTGKRGIPHWRPSKPRWPGVLPSLALSETVPANEADG